MAVLGLNEVGGAMFGDKGGLLLTAKVASRWSVEEVESSVIDRRKNTK